MTASISLVRPAGFAFPTFSCSPLMNNHGNYIASLGLLCRWMAKQAEDLGVEIYPAIAGADIEWEAGGVVAGVITGDFWARAERRARTELHTRHGSCAANIR